MALSLLSAPTGALELPPEQLEHRLYSATATGPFEGHFTMDHGKRMGPGANWVHPAAVVVEHGLLCGEAGGAPCGLRSWQLGATVTLAGNRRGSLEVLQVEFRCTSGCHATRHSDACRTVVAKWTARSSHFIMIWQQWVGLLMGHCRSSSYSYSYM